MPPDQLFEVLKWARKKVLMPLTLKSLVYILANIDSTIRHKILKTHIIVLNDMKSKIFFLKLAKEWRSVL